VLQSERLSELRAAVEAERTAESRARAARHHVDLLIAQTLSSGATYDHIARVTLRVRLGRAPTVKERQREIDNLRHRRRRAMTRGHGNVARPGLKTARPAVRSPAEVKAMTERLIRRKTVEEEFITEEPDEDKDAEQDDDECADDTKAAAAGDEDDDEEEEDEEEGAD